MTDASGTKCPKCLSGEWFPGGACWDCGWEGSAADAHDFQHKRIAELQAERDALASVLWQIYGNADDPVGELIGRYHVDDDVAAKAIEIGRQWGEE